MKNLKRAECAVIALTLLCLFFTAGYFTGRGATVRVVSIDRHDAASAPVSAGPAAVGDTGKQNPAGSNPAGSNPAVSNPAPSDTAAMSAGQAVPDTGSPAAVSSEKSDASLKININTASSALLDQLPGIGPVLAQSIIDYRSKIGGFSKIDQIMDVDGIGEKKFAAMKDMITVG